MWYVTVFPFFSCSFSDSAAVCCHCLLIRASIATGQRVPTLCQSFLGTSKGGRQLQKQQRVPWNATLERRLLIGLSPILTSIFYALQWSGLKLSMRRGVLFSK